jgi:hypothetical protein
MKMKTKQSINFYFLKLIIAALILIILTEPAAAQVVSPVQSGHFVPCVTNIRDMSHPSPGLFVMWNNVYISSDEFIDRNGNEFNTIKLNQIDPRLPNIDVKLDVDGFTTIPVVAWVSHFTLLGGARYMPAVSPNYITASGTIISETSLIDTTVTKIDDENVSGFSDFYVSPLGLSWGLDKFDITLSYGFYAPTGRYETGASDNVGVGFWTHQFQGYGYFYPFPDKSTALMAALTYELNSEIEDADVKPGNRFTLEWGISQYLSEQFELGVHGGHNWQISDDKGSDVFWDPTVLDRKSTLAFSAAYWPWKNRLYINAKYAFDFDVRQRFKNNYWMFNLIFLTNALTGE